MRYLSYDEKRSLLLRCGGEKELYSEYRTILYQRGVSVQREVEKLQRGFDSFLRWAENPHHQIVTIEESGYPHLLKESNEPPLILSYIGNYQLLQSPLSLVGTHALSLSSLRALKALAKECSQEKVELVGGFSFNGDQEAYQTSKGYSIALLGGGLDSLKFMRAQSVGAHLMRGNLFLSPFHPYATASNWRYLYRNKVIVSLSKVTALIESSLSSRAYQSLLFALDNGREVVVHKCGVDSNKGSANRSLAEEGSKVISSLYDLFR